MKIGIFDSGIGGLTVLIEALKVIPDQDFLYYADTENVPYGTKPKQEVKGYILAAANTLVSRGAEVIVIACNTATSVAIEELRNTLSIPVLGMEPAVKPAVEKNATTSKRVLVTATPLAIKEEKLKNLITRVDNEDIVDLLPLPGLVEFAESMCFDESKIEKYLKMELEPFDLETYGTIVLGCTHFPYFINNFRRLLPRETDIIDGSHGTVKHLKSVIMSMDNYTTGKGNIEFFNSGTEVVQGVELERFKSLLEYLDKRQCQGMEENHL